MTEPAADLDGVMDPKLGPFARFDLWFAEAQAKELNDPNAMALATADAAGRPSVRNNTFLRSDTQATDST